MEYDKDEFSTSGLAGRSPSSCLGIEAARLEAARYRLGAGCQRGGGEPMDASWPRRRRRRLAPCFSSRGILAYASLAATGVAGDAGIGSRSLRFSWRGVDRKTGSCPDPTPLGSLLSSRPYHPSVASLGFHSTKAHAHCPPSRRASHCPVVPRNLAGLEKKAAAEGRTVVCLDESAFYLLPSLVRTWALRGHPPDLSAIYSRDHLSAISAITPQGQLYIHLKEGALDNGDVARFLCHLLRHLPGKLLILWDRASIHRGEAIRRLLATDHQRDLWLEPFPPYAPQLNPDEGIWHYLKNVELPNLCCDTIKQLRAEIHQAVNRIRQKTQIVIACFQKAGLVV